MRDIVSTVKQQISTAMRELRRGETGKFIVLEKEWEAASESQRKMVKALIKQLENAKGVAVKLFVRGEFAVDRLADLENWTTS